MDSVNQVLSRTFKKEEFRRLTASDLSDEEYLDLNISKVKEFYK